MRNKRLFYASHESLTAQGATKTEAKENLEKMIDWALKDHSPFTEFRYGCVLVAAATANGWWSSVTPPDRQTHGAHADTSCFYGQCDRETIISSIRTHAAQIAWTFDVNDKEHASKSGLNDTGVKDLLRYFAWQRAYKNAKDHGASDKDAHEIASGLRSLAA